MIYLDHHSTTPLDPRVLEAMLPYMKELFGNPSSSTHKYGWDTQEAVDTAREQVAGAINCEPHQIIFTSGATEANNTILKSFNSITFSVLEHSSIIEVCMLKNKKKILSADKKGIIQLEKSTNDITTIMMVNNEIGTIQNIKEAANLKGSYLFHSDMAQALGKIPIDVKDLNVNFASLSAHKVYGPKGIGAIYAKDIDLINPLIHGGKQEMGIRAGTLNVPAIVGFGKACEIITNELNDIVIDLNKKTKFFKDLLKKINVKVYDFNSVPGSISAIMPCDVMYLFNELSDKLALSSTSACLSSYNEPSRILRAIGVPDEEAKRFIRFCIGRFNTFEELELSAKYIAEAIGNYEEVK